jgi:adenylyltransferase/sulfurtransferase
MDEPKLTDAELRRYARHLAMPEVGLAGQQRLKAARVLCIGAGGLGSPATLYLAAAGIGTLGLVEFDRVDFHNLQRQILYTDADVGRPKLAVAAARLRALNPAISVREHDMAFRAASAPDLLREYDIVVDGSDNFATRYLVNDACVIFGRPNVYGSIFRFEGQASVFAAKGGPCYRCLHPEPPPPGLIQNCAEGGVLGVLPGIIGAIQAAEAIKLALGQGVPLIGRFLVVDALAMRFRELKLNRDPACPVCGDAPTIRALQDYDDYCDGIVMEDRETVTVEELKDRMDRQADFVLVDVREQSEYDICRIQGAQLIPLAQLSARFSEIPKDREVILHCRSGMRSARAAHFLRGRGYGNVHNLEGGILAWIDRIDPTQPKY